MRKTLFATTAAMALLAASGIGLAQSGSGAGAGGSGGAGASSGAPAGGGSMGGGGAQERTGSEPRQPRGGSAQQGAPGEGRTGQSSGSRNDREQAQTPREGQRDGRTGQREGQRDGQGQRESQGQRSGDRDTNRAGTTEQRGGGNVGSAPSNVQVTTEQRTRIRERRTVLSAGRVTNVNFNISVGTTVPHSVRVYDLPVEIVEIVPAYRGYKYILVEDEIVIIEPSTLRIVAVIDA